jgi:hypothetical protein
MYYVTQVKFTDQIDTNKGVKEKVFKHDYLVEAVSVTDAEKSVHKVLEDSAIDFEVISVKSSKIIEVIDTNG